MSIQELKETDTNSIVRHINNLVSWVNAVVGDMENLYTQLEKLRLDENDVKDIKHKVDGLQQLFGRVQLLEEQSTNLEGRYTKFRSEMLERKAPFRAPEVDENFINMLVPGMHVVLADYLKKMTERVSALETDADDKLVTLREILLWVANESMREFQNITIKVKHVMAVCDVIKVNGKREYGRCKVKMADGTSFHIKGDAKEIIKLIWGDKS